MTLSQTEIASRSANLVFNHETAKYALNWQDIDLTDTNWISVCTGIIIAGGIYPVALYLIGSLFTMIAFAWAALTGSSSTPSISELMGAAIGMGVGSLL